MSNCFLKLFVGNFSEMLVCKIKGTGWNFERPNVERPIFQNLKVANVKSYERSSYSIFLVQIFNFNALIFYNFPNLIFFALKFFFN